MENGLRSATGDLRSRQGRGRETRPTGAIQDSLGQNVARRQAGAWWTAWPSAGLIEESLNLIRVAGAAKVDHNLSRLAVQGDRRGIDPITDPILLEHFPDVPKLEKGSIRYGRRRGRPPRGTGSSSTRRA